MKQGHIIDSLFTGDASSMPVSDAGSPAESPTDGQQGFNQILDALVQVLARRVASIIIEDGDMT